MEQGHIADPSTFTESNTGTIATPASSPAPIAEEKMVKQSVVDHVVGRAKQEALERGQRMERERIEAEQRANLGHSSAANNPSATPQAVPQNEIERIAEEAVQRKLGDIALQNDYRQRQAVADQQAQQFIDKLNAGKALYPDYETVIAPLVADLNDTNGGVLLKLVPHLGKTENMAEILYDLGKNPQKIGQLLGVADSAALSKQALDVITSSIKLNKDAANRKIANSPLSQVQPSNTGVDNGSTPLAAAKTKYRF